MPYATDRWLARDQRGRAILPTPSVAFPSRQRHSRSPVPSSESTAESSGQSRDNQHELKPGHPRNGMAPLRRATRIAVRPESRFVGGCRLDQWSPVRRISGSLPDCGPIQDSLDRIDKDRFAWLRMSTPAPTPSAARSARRRRGASPQTGQHGDRLLGGTRVESPGGLGRRQARRGCRIGHPGGLCRRKALSIIASG